MIAWDGLALLDPFVHAPEMGVVELELERINDARDQRQLLRWTDRATDPGRLAGRGLLPSFNIFERFREIKILERFVVVNRETGSRQFEQTLLRQLRGVFEDFRIQRGVIPPLR